MANDDGTEKRDDSMELDRERERYDAEVRAATEEVIAKEPWSARVAYMYGRLDSALYAITRAGEEVLKYPDSAMARAWLQQAIGRCKETLANADRAWREPMGRGGNDAP